MQNPSALLASEALTPAELELLQDTRYCMLRQSALAKVEQQLTAVQQELESWLTLHPGLPAPVYALRGRISRGEQYKDVDGISLPYRVLDCPRLFTPELTLAYRVVFLWGLGWSQHLLLSGPKSEPLRKRLLDTRHSFDDVELDLRPTPWKLEPTGLMVHNNQPTAAHPFLKLSRYQPVGSATWPTEAICWWNELGLKLVC